MAPPPATFVDAFARLPDDEARGFRFVGGDGVERYFSFRAMRDEAGRRAALLFASGVSKGDRVALVIGEGHDFVLTFLGCVLAGAVPVPIFPRATFKATQDYVDTVAHIAEAAAASVLLCSAGNAALLAPARERVPTLARLETVEDLFALDRTVPAFVAPEIQADDLCFLQFTSGSTARPKGVMVSHANLLANARAFLGPHGLDRRPDDLGVSWLPLFHDMGLIGFVLGPLIVDIPVVLLPTATFARGPRVWLETIAKHRGTITYAPNFAYALAVKRLKPKDVEALDLSCVRVAGCGAEPIQADTLRAFARALAPAGFRETALLPSYGMAESTLAVTFHPLGTPMMVDSIALQGLQRGVAIPDAGPDALPFVSCGVAFPDHALTIVDEHGQPRAEREVGEIVVQGPSVTRGYFQNEEATAAALRNGALHTGDLGYLADGRLYVCGRIKDLIIIRGANFHAQDLEWAVSELEGVRRGNVVALGLTLEGEERLILAVECTSTEADAVKAKVAARINEAFGLNPYEIVAVTVGSLPKTSSGKLQRRKVADLYRAGQLERHHG